MDFRRLRPYSPVNVITFLSVFVFATWRFRGKGWIVAFYNGVMAALFMLFLYEVLFNINGGFPPTDLLPLWGVGLLVSSILLGLLQVHRYFALQRLSIVLFSAFIVDWFVWILVGFPFNLPSTQPLNLVAEVFNVTTKLLLPFGYATGLTVRKKSEQSPNRILKQVQVPPKRETWSGVDPVIRLVQTRRVAFSSRQYS